MIKLYFFGKKTEITPQEQEYIKRIGYREKIDIVALPQAGVKDEAALKRMEADKLLAKLTEDDHMILFDERGEKMTSPGFATYLSQHLKLYRNVVFVIGGAYGVDAIVRERADIVLSVGDMIWTRNLFRTMALEQIYRALEISGGGHFHKS